MTPLTTEQKFLLEWLSTEDQTSLGECSGDDLDALVDLGYVSIDPVPAGCFDANRRAVRVTEIGLKTIAEARGECV